MTSGLSTQRWFAITVAGLTFLPFFIASSVLNETYSSDDLDFAWTFVSLILFLVGAAVAVMVFRAVRVRK